MHSLHVAWVGLAITGRGIWIASKVAWKVTQAAHAFAKPHVLTFAHRVAQTHWGQRLVQSSPGRFAATHPRFAAACMAAVVTISFVGMIAFAFSSKGTSKEVTVAANADAISTDNPDSKVSNQEGPTAPPVAQAQKEQAPEQASLKRSGQSFGAV